MIGIYGDAQGVWHGFLLNKGVYTSYDPPGSIHTEIYDVDNLGNVVGLYYAYNPVFAVYTYSGFLLSSKGVFTQIVFPGSFFSDAGGINLSGVIGGAYASASEFNNGTYHGFLRTP